MVHYTLSERVQHTSQTAQMRVGKIHYGPEKDRSSAVCSCVELLTGSDGEVVERAGIRDSNLFFLMLPKQDIIQSCGLCSLQYQISGQTNQ